MKDCPLIFDKRYCNALQTLYEAQKDSDYELIKAAGFDSEEVYEMWDESEDDVESFIEYLNELEVQGLARMNEMEDENEE